VADDPRFSIHGYLERRSFHGVTSHASDSNFTLCFSCTLRSFAHPRDPSVIILRKAHADQIETAAIIKQQTHLSIMYHVHVYLYIYIYIYFFFLSRDLLHLHLLLRDSRHYTHAHSSDIHRVNVALTTAEASTVAHPASFLHPHRVLHLILSSLGSSVATVRNYPSSTSGYTPVTRPAVLRQCCSLTMHQAKDTATRSSRPIRARSSLNCAHGDETPFPHRAVDVCPCVM